MIYLVITEKKKVVNCIPFELVSEGFNARSQCIANIRLGDILKETEYLLSHNPKRIGAEYHG